MYISWGDTAAVFTVLVVISGGVLLMLKSIFVTKKVCNGTHKDTDKTVCKKIDEVKKDVLGIKKTIDEMNEEAVEVRKKYHTKDIWLAESIRAIADATGANVESMPK